jgi:hypothetical protein
VGSNPTTSAMSKEQWYVQVRLINSPLVDVVWIPKQFAVVGKTLSIRIDGEWSDGWLVLEVYKDIIRNISDSERQREAQKRWYSCLK